MSEMTAQKFTAIITAAEWLSGVFNAAPSKQRVEQASAPQEQEALRWIGEKLDAPRLVETLRKILTQDAPEELSVHLQRSFTQLFEGIFRNRAVLPYESAWIDREAKSSNGSCPVIEMNAVLYALDMRVSENCPEPADHISVELAALSTALRAGQDSIAVELLDRLQGWIPNFAEVLAEQDVSGFYAASSKLLLVLIKQASLELKNAKTAAVIKTEENLGVTL